MVAQRCLRPAPVFDEPTLRRAFEAAGVKEVHLGAVWQHVISSAGAGKPEDAPGLPGSAREVLQRQFAAVTSSVQEVKTSADGSTTKLLIRLQVRQCSRRRSGAEQLGLFAWRLCDPSGRTRLEERRALLGPAGV